MPYRFLERLNSGKILISDGATGTNLQKAGLKAGVSPEAWVMEKPEKILELEKAFVQAGSDIILTCTFGGTNLRLAGSNYSGRAVEINHKAVEIAQAAIADNPDVMIAGSLGPVGGLLKPFGPLEIEAVRSSYAEQAKALVEAGVDLLVIETQFSIEEAQAALEAVRATGDIPVVVSFSYDRGVRTMMGVQPAQVTKTFIPSGISAVGTNCGTSLENMEKIVNQYAELAPGFPIWAKPNAGLPGLDANGETVYNITPEQMGEASLKFIGSGARVVGGCCGNTPGHISMIARMVRKV